MPKIADLVTSLGTGWKLTGTGTPIEEVQTIPNPMASNPIAPANTPSTITQGTGRYYVVVQDPDGHQRAMFLTASSDQGVSGPGLTPTPPITGKDQPPGTRAVAGNELANLNWDQAGAVQDVPAGSTTKQPSATDKLDLIDAKGNVVPAGDPSAKQMRDPATGTTFNLVTDPAGTLHDFGKDVYLVKPDGSRTFVGTSPKEASQYNVAGVGLVDYDPNKPEGSRTSLIIKAPAPNDPKTEVRDGVTYQYDPDTKAWIKTDLPPDVQIGYTYNDPNSDTIVFYDKSGKEVGRQSKPGWKPPINVQPGSAPAADLVSAKIPQFNPQTGALEFVDNPNQIKASEATSQLAQQLGLKVAAGSMSEKQAQDLITGAVNAMNAQSQQAQAQAQQAGVARAAAGDILTNTAQNAQTGAGLINQRVQAASGMLQNILGQATGAKNLMSAPAGLGEALTQGIAGYTAQLAGGQGTLDSAARLVQQADPRSNMADPATQHAIGVLQQMLDKYQDITGAPHPAVAATQAAAQSQQTGGMTTPYTQMSPLGGGVANSIPGGVASQPYETAAQSQARNAAAAQQAVGGTGFTPPGGSSYTYPSVPWAGATPQPLQSQTGFVAPPAPVRGAPVTITVG